MGAAKGGGVSLQATRLQRRDTVGLHHSMRPNVPRLASDTPNVAVRGPIPWGRANQFARCSTGESAILRRWKMSVRPRPSEPINRGCCCVGRRTASKPVVLETAGVRLIHPLPFCICQYTGIDNQVSERWPSGLRHRVGNATRDESPSVSSNLHSLRHS